MKYFVLFFIIVFGTGSLYSVHAFQEKVKSAEIDFEKIDAVEAMAVANDWKWSRKDVKSSVTVREVVFEFSDGTKKQIPLPEERMLVAVAPYIRRTHK